MARAQISKLCDIRMVPLCNSFTHCLQILSNQSYYTIRWLDHCTHAWCGFEIGHAFLHNPSLFCACIKRLHGDQLSSAYLLIFLTDPWRRHHCNAGWASQDSAVLDGLGRILQYWEDLLGKELVGTWRNIHHLSESCMSLKK